MSVGVEENRGRTRSATALPRRRTVQTWEGAGFVQTTWGIPGGNILETQGGRGFV